VFQPVKGIIGAGKAIACQVFRHIVGAYHGADGGISVFVKGYATGNGCPFGVNRAVGGTAPLATDPGQPLPPRAESENLSKERIEP
jgi:hypothetical protein